MKRPIDANVLRETWLCLEGKDFQALDFVHSIDAQPTIAAEPVRHGKWLWLDGVRCSECNYKLETTGLPSYCPNCGCRVDEE